MRIGGVETIISLLPRQCREEAGREISQTTRTQTNNHLRFTLRTFRHLTEPEIKQPYYSRISTGANLRAVLGTLTGQTTKGLALQVFYKLMRESHETSTQVPSPRYDERGSTDLHLTKTREIRIGPRIATLAQDLLYRLETETQAIERAIETLYNHSSQHHIAQSTGIRILQSLTPKGYFLSERTPMDRSPLWIHPSSGTYFDTLPDLVAVSTHITYWHSHKDIWQTRKGTILVPIAGRVKQMVQILLWNHYYIDMEPFLQGITAHKIT